MQPHKLSQRVLATEAEVEVSVTQLEVPELRLRSKPGTLSAFVTASRRRSTASDAVSKLRPRSAVFFFVLCNPGCGVRLRHLFAATAEGSMICSEVRQI